MTGVDYWHKRWQCPFFRWDERLVVGCEGGKLRFPDKAAALAYMEQHCATQGWKQCSVAIALLAYYEREEKHENISG